MKERSTQSLIGCFCYTEKVPRIPRHIPLPDDLPEEQLQMMEDAVFVDPDPQPADLLFVFGHSLEVIWDNVADLYHQKFAPLILVSGRHPLDWPADAPIEAHVIRDVLLQNNVPADCILVEDQSTNTWENVVNSKKLLAQKGIRPASILFVTKSYHSGRCRKLLQKHFPGVTLHCAHIPTLHKGIPVTKENWREQKVTRELVAGEYARIKKYGLRK